MSKKTGLISKNQKEQILKATDIVQLISGYVQLKASGKNYIGLCPFHKEKTPSFTVSPTHQNYKCYGCGEFGDAIRFIMEIENFQFVEAVQYLGDRCGIKLSFDRESAAVRKEQTELNRCLEISFDFYRKNLIRSGDGSQIRKYLKQRLIADASEKDFELGYVGQGWSNLYSYLMSQSISPVVQEKAGLVKRGEKGGYYDLFRNRLIFPIRDHQARLLGFAGRALGDGKPKYLNPPETELYKKGSILFGTHLAKEQIRKKRRAFVVEGYLDAICMHRHSWNETVATCGTALTVDHISLIKRLGAESVYLLFDGDRAGIEAAERSAALFISSNLDSKVIILPGELDPDDYFKQYSSDDFQKLIDNAVFDYEFIIDQARRNANGTGIEHQRRIIENVLKIGDGIKGDLKKELFHSKVSSAFNVHQMTLRRTAGYQPRKLPEPPIRQNDNQTRISFQKEELAELKLIQYLISHTQAITFVRTVLTPDDFINPEISKLYARFLQLSNQEFVLLQAQEFPEVFVEHGNLIFYLLHYKVEYSGPAVNRKRSPDSVERDREIVSLEADNKIKVNEYSETVVKKLVRRVKQRKLANEKKKLFQIDEEKEREKVMRIAQRRKSINLT